jgi:hypothetical protein
MRMEGSIMGLKDLLLVFVSGGGGAVVFWLMGHVGFLMRLSAEYKRYASLILAGVLPIPFWLAGVAMQYWAAPPTWRGWVEIIFALAAGAILVSQGLHGRTQLRADQ